jgi:hypothetical protein
MKLNFYKQSNSNITKAICDHYETWTEDKISARQTQLAKEAKSIWKLDF